MRSEIELSYRAIVGQLHFNIQSISIHIENRFAFHSIAEIVGKVSVECQLGQITYLKKNEKYRSPGKVYLHEY